MTRHFLSIADLNPEELKTVLDLSEDTAPAKILSGKGVALVFEHPSARTRNAFELAVIQLGGHPVAIRGDEVGIDKRETAEDVAQTLACYHSAIAARVARHTTIERMAVALDGVESGVPVVNLLSDREHPTQALADLLTIRQKCGGFEGRTLAYVGDANNVCRSLLGGSALTGLRMRVASPEGYGLEPADLAWVRSLGGAVEVCSSPAEAVAGCDVIYTDVWVSMGQEEEGSARRGAFGGYTVDEELVALAGPQVTVLHCLPAHRGEEITAGVLAGPNSAVWEQAANRMHVGRGLFRFLLGEASQANPAMGDRS